MEKKILLIPCKEVSEQEKLSREINHPLDLYHFSLPGYISISPKENFHVVSLRVPLCKRNRLIQKIYSSFLYSPNRTFIFGTHQKLKELLPILRRKFSLDNIDISLTEKNYAGFINYYCHKTADGIVIYPRNITCPC